MSEAALKIKVIKKNTIANCCGSAAPVKKSEKTIERQIASNISGWITEFRQHRREEQRQYRLR